MSASPSVRRDDSSSSVLIQANGDWIVSRAFDGLSAQLGCTAQSEAEDCSNAFQFRHFETHLQRYAFGILAVVPIRIRLCGLEGQF